MKRRLAIYALSIALSACGGNNLALLKDGQQAFYDGKYEQSDAKFEEFNRKNIDPTKTTLGAELRILSLGAGTGDYKPYMMDLLFVSYYQILDALAVGKTDVARVIINQSYARQQEMSRAYAKLIERNKADKNRKKLPPLPNEQWKAYGDIMNPALTYLAGLYYLNTADNAPDWETARTYLSRASGMMPDNKAIAEDLKLAEEMKKPTGTTWTFTETGRAPKLRERRFDIPWPTPNGIRMISTATAEAELTPGADKPPKSELLADADAMFLAEFKEYRVNDVLRAIAKTVANMALQEATANKNPLLGLSAVIYSMATTRAETRSWDALPKYIRLQMKTGGRENKLIYIRNNAITEIRI
jgi:hypothetical protein